MTPEDSIRKAMLRELWRSTFPARVWEQGSRGWTSREPTAEDRERRSAVAEDMARCRS